MKTNHLLETEIQAYILDIQHCDSHIIDHIQECVICSERADAYLLIFSSIKEQPKPEFDFDLTELVMQQLPQTRAKVTMDKTIVLIITLVAVFSIGVAIYFFRSFLSDLLIGLAPMLIYLVSTCVICLFIFIGTDMYADYNKKLKILNYY